jgi:hypothetical protein
VPGPAPDWTPAAQMAEKHRGRWDIVYVGEGVSFIAVERLPDQPQPAIILAGSVDELDRQLEDR